MKDLRHPFVQHPTEHAGICECGDVEFVHRPLTVGRIVRRVLFDLDYWWNCEENGARVVLPSAYLAAVLGLAMVSLSWLFAPPLPHYVGHAKHHFRHHVHVSEVRP